MKRWVRSSRSLTRRRSSTPLLARIQREFPGACGAVVVLLLTLIGVGRSRFAAPPSLRTVQAVLPHTALRSVVHLQEDWQSVAWAVAKENSPCSLK